MYAIEKFEMKNFLKVGFDSSIPIKSLDHLPNALACSGAPPWQPLFDRLVHQSRRFSSQKRRFQ
jgi:hypothetical protein